MYDLERIEAPTSRCNCPACGSEDVHGQYDEKKLVWSIFCNSCGTGFEVPAEDYNSDIVESYQFTKEEAIDRWQNELGNMVNKSKEDVKRLFGGEKLC